MSKRIIAFFMVMVMGLTLLTGCGGKKEDGNVVRVGMMTNGLTLPLYYAQQNGYFDELGIELQVEFFANGPTINEAIASGDIDVAGIGEMPSITGAITNRSKVIAWMSDDEATVLCYARNDSDIVKAGKGHVEGCPDIYGTAAEWKGKEVICAKGTSSHFGLLQTLKKLGLSESDITLINMEGTAGAAAFASGTGDIFFGFDPQWAEFYSNPDQYTQISSIAATGEKLCTALIASEEFAANQPELASKVIQAMLKAEQVFEQDQDAYRKAMYEWQSSYGDFTEDLADVCAEWRPIRSLDYQKEIFEGAPSAMAESYENVAQFMVDNEVISQADKDSISWEDVFLTDYLYQAIDQLK